MKLLIFENKSGWVLEWKLDPHILKRIKKNHELAIAKTPESAHLRGNYFKKFKSKPIGLSGLFPLKEIKSNDWITKLSISPESHKIVLNLLSSK